MLWKSVSWGFFFFLILAEGVQAHPADVSYLRIVVERKKLEFRFTFTLLTLVRLVTLDRNGDQKLDSSELESAKPELSKILQEDVLLRINGRTESLGVIEKLEALWPLATAVDLGELDRVVDVVFIKKSSDPIANIWTELTCFPKMGEEATIQATYEQGNLRMQVPFSRGEPDYLYDTGFSVEDIFKEVAVDQPQQSLPAPSSVSGRWGWASLIGLLVFALLGWIFRRNKDH